MDWLREQSGEPEAVAVDALRYYLIRDISFTSDSEFTYETLLKRTTTTSRTTRQPAQPHAETWSSNIWAAWFRTAQLNAPPAALCRPWRSKSPPKSSAPWTPSIPAALVAIWKAG